MLIAGRFMVRMSPFVPSESCLCVRELASPGRRPFALPGLHRTFQPVTNPDSTRAATLRLAGYSFLILFFELALIRYVPGHVRVFGFYLNFVLMATFLGMG